MSNNKLFKANWNPPTKECSHDRDVACGVCNPQLWSPTIEQAVEYCTESLGAEIIKAKDLYYNHGKSGLSDLEYDRLESSLKAINPKASILQQVGAVAK
jgi:hypothetical protein